MRVAISCAFVDTIPRAVRAAEVARQANGYVHVHRDLQVHVRLDVLGALPSLPAHSIKSTIW